MFILIDEIILIGSILGIGIMVFEKLPEFKKISESKVEEEEEKKISEILYKFKKLLSKRLIQRFISEIKKINLLTESKISTALQKKEKNKKRGGDDYWDKIIKISKKK